MTEPSPRHRLSVCTTCRIADEGGDVRAGRRLFDLVSQAFEGGQHDDVSLAEIECMSGCNRACTISLAAAGKPSYLFGDLRPERDTAEQVVELLRLYRDSQTGVLLRGQRPPILRSGILAKLPPPPL